MFLMFMPQFSSADAASQAEANQATTVGSPEKRLGLGSRHSLNWLALHELFESKEALPWLERTLPNIFRSNQRG
jgi:hypothetical protein